MGSDPFLSLGSDPFLSSYETAGRLADSHQLLDETIRQYKTGDISQNGDAAAALLHFGRTLIREGDFTGAESAIRESLPIFARVSDDFSIAYANSLLGETLAGQKKYADAEPLLQDGFQSMKKQEDQIRGNGPETLAEAAGRLAALYTAWGKPDSAEHWRAGMVCIRNSAPTTAPAAGN